MLKSVVKKVSFFLLAFIFLFSSVFLISQPKKVKADGLVIGASLIIAALSSYMAASGVQITSNSNTGSSDVVAMWEEICQGYESAGKTLESWYGSASQAVNVLIGTENAQKTIVVSTALSNWFEGLRDWLIGNKNLNSTSDTVIMDSYYVNTNVGKLLVYDSFNSVQNSGARPQSIMGTGFGDDTTIEFNDTYKLRYSFFENSSTHNLAYYSWYMTDGTTWVNGASGTSTKVNSASVFLFKSLYNNQYYLYVGYSYESPYSSGRFYTQQNTNFRVPVADVDGNAISVSGSLADGYQDYQDALSDAQSDAGEKGNIAIDTGDWTYDGALTKEKVADAYLDRIAVTGTAEGTLVGGYTDEKETEEETGGEYVPSEAWYGNNIVVVDGLEDFFPFCIPWDFYHVIELLNVTPEAPKFTYNVDLSDTPLNMDYETELDLAPFETVAIVFRALIIVAFLIFLIIKTRDLIRG